jgi:hypothetical protein
MSKKSTAVIATMGVGIGKNSFHVVGQDRRGEIVLRQKWSRGQVEARLANNRSCPQYCVNGASQRTGPRPLIGAPPKQPGSLCLSAGPDWLHEVKHDGYTDWRRSR